MSWTPAGLSLIRWGPGLLNELVLGYPLDKLLCGRRERDGSDHGAALGTMESWITGRDFEVNATLRWLPHGAKLSPVAQTGWSGPTGVQAFLDWARDGNPFTFVPDQRYPEFHADGCYLTDPFDGDGEMEADGTRSLPILFTHPTLDLHLMLRGLAFEYKAGGSLVDPLVFTFSRSSIATYLDKTGAVADVASGVVRDQHVARGYRALLIEPSRINQCLWSEDLANAAWVQKLGVTITSDATASPKVGVSADKVVEDTSTGNHQVRQRIAMTAGSAIARKAYVKAGERTKISLFVQGAVTPGDWIGLTADLTAQTVAIYQGGVGSTTFVYLDPLGQGWYEIGFGGVLNPGDVNGDLWLRLRDNTGMITYTGDGESGAYFWGMQAENNFVSPSTYIPTTTAAVTRVSEALTYPVPANITPTSNWTLYLKVVRAFWMDQTGLLDGWPSPFIVGSGPGAFRIYFDKTARMINAQLWDGGGTSRTPSPMLSIPAGNVIECCMQAVDWATAPRCRLDVGAGWGAWSPTGTPRATFVGNLMLGGSGGDSWSGGILVARLAPGAKTLKEMREI